MTMSISRCTQNPTFMEEWRKGWHPERIDAKGISYSVLVVGAGPAGLEAARALGMRGYQVALAEAGRETGGRVLANAKKLPGLSAWGRVKDYRDYQLSQMANVDIYFDSALGPPMRSWNSASSMSPSPPARRGGGMASPAGMWCRCRSRTASTGLHARRPDGRAACRRAES